MTENPLDTISKAAQECIQQVPVIVLGSGASVPHGIRGVQPLSEYLQAYLATEGEAETKAWEQIVSQLQDGIGLEEALQAVSAPSSLVEKIVFHTWHAIAADDVALSHRAALGVESFPLTNLIQGLFRSTATTVNIVTPNYDRIAEYASDLAGFIHLNGFVPGLIRRREGADTLLVRRGNYPARTVRVWKVHGSLDWFEDPQGSALSLPISTELPENLNPLIVTPGVSKFERTHDEPFRSSLQGSDSALGGASAFLCVGYGFRDTHIQPRLVENCRQRNVPVVVLAKELTEEAKDFLRNSAGDRYMALEDCDEGTRFYSNEYRDGLVIEGHKLWSFEDFNNLAL